MSATAVLYGLKAAAGVAQGIFGYRQMQEASRREQALRAQGVPQMQTPQEYFDLYQNASRSRQFEEEKAMTQSILAPNLATLQGAGSRAVIGGAPAAQITAQRGIASAANRDFARQQQALGQLAAAQQRTAQLNFQVDANQYARDLMTAQAGYQAGVETMLGGFDTAIGAGVGMAGAMKSANVGADPDPKSGGFFDSFGNEVSVKPGSEKDFFSEDPTLGQQDSTPFGLRRNDAGLDFDAPSVPGPMNFNFQTSGFQPIDFNKDGYTAPFDAASSFPAGNVPQGGIVVPAGGYSTQQEAAFKNPGVQIVRGSDGFFYPQYAKGGSVTTPGKYTADHSVEYDVKTKSGKTIATVTGDETLVFNPQQRRFLKKVIGKLIKGQTIKPSKADTKQANQTLKAFKK